jgi:hypothetical protein
VTTSGCSSSDENGSTKTTTYTRHSVFGQNFGFGVCNDAVDIPPCATGSIEICTNRMYIQNTGGLGEPSLKEVDRYVWTIPAGWRETGTNTTGPGTVNTTANSINITPLTTEGGTLL